MAKIYDPTQYVITMGDLPITGFASGTYLKVTQIKESGSVKVGADGTSVIVISRDRTYRATVTLMPTEDSVDDLSAFHAQFKAQAVRGDGIKTFMVKDLADATVVHSDELRRERPRSRWAPTTSVHASSRSC